MFGKMQDVPLQVDSILDHALVNHGEREIVSRLVEGNIHRETYADMRLRARKLSQALQSWAWGRAMSLPRWRNTRSFEAWYGITGIGAVYHTLNPPVPRPAHLYYQSRPRPADFDRFDLFANPRRLADSIPNVQGIIVLTDAALMWKPH